MSPNFETKGCSQTIVFKRFEGTGFGFENEYVSGRKNETLLYQNERQTQLNVPPMLFGCCY